MELSTRELVEELLYVVSQNTGGSGTGFTFYATAHTCGRQASFKLSHKDIDDSGDDSKVGTVFHKLREWQEKGRLVGTFHLDDYTVDPVLIEAWRLHYAYTKLFPPRNAYTVLGSEFHIPKDCDEDAKKRLVEWTGGIPLTGQFDQLIEIKEEQLPAFWLTYPELAPYIRYPGRYIWDYKTKKQRDNNLQDLAKYHIQFRGYQALHNVVFPETPVRGLIAEYIIRHKTIERDKSFIYGYVPWDETHLDVAKRFIEVGHQRLLANEPNAAACAQWRGCPYREICNVL